MNKTQQRRSRLHFSFSFAVLPSPVLFVPFPVSLFPFPCSSFASFPFRVLFERPPVTSARFLSSLPMFRDKTQQRRFRLHFSFSFAVCPFPVLFVRYVSFSVLFVRYFSFSRRLRSLPCLFPSVKRFLCQQLPTHKPKKHTTRPFRKNPVKCIQHRLEGQMTDALRNVTSHGH